MSVEEDTELRDLVSKTLENNGVLAKIRAELRASVFLALEEQDSYSAPFENKALKDFLKSPQAALGLCIVREFLEYLELDFTLSVYNTETSHGKGYDYSGRNKLVKDLQIKQLNGKKGPLLSHILQIAQEASGISLDIKDEAAHIDTANMKQSLGGGPFHNISLESGTSAESPNVSLAPLDRTFTSEGPSVKGILSPSSSSHDEEKSKILLLSHPSFSSESQIKSEEKQDARSNDSTLLQAGSANTLEVNLGKALSSKDGAQHKNYSSIKSIDNLIQDSKQILEGGDPQIKQLKNDGKNPMASLNDLPPLDGFQGRRNLNNASGINFASLGIQDDYEEDFLSTDSSAALEDNSKGVSQKSSSKQSLHNRKEPSVERLTKDITEKETSDKAATNSPAGSISEDLDDDTNSGLDDLLNSTASTENTVDATISHIRSNFANYIEEV